MVTINKTCFTLESNVFPLWESHVLQPHPNFLIPDSDYMMSLTARHDRRREFWTQKLIVLSRIVSHSE